MTNWSSMAKAKGREWYLAASLIALGNEVNRTWPRRTTASDGAIGDASHQARKSDHNPDYSAGGVVRAIDIDVHGIDAPALVKALIGDPRVWYVIYDHYIYSVTYGWAKRPYDGTDPHTGHIHVSIRHTTAAETNTGLWLSVSGNHKPTPEDDMPLNAADKKYIEDRVQAYAAFGAKHTDQVLRTAVTTILNAVKGVDSKAAVAELNAELDKRDAAAATELQGISDNLKAHLADD